MSRKDTTKYNSNLQEKKVAKEVKGRTVIGSGCLWGSKGDVKTENYLIECKTTSKNYYSLKVDTWLKIAKEANNEGMRLPVMCVDLLDGKFRYAIIDKRHFELDNSMFDNKFIQSKSFRVRISNLYINNIIGTSFDKVCLQLVVLPWEDFLEICLKREV